MYTRARIYDGQHVVPRGGHITRFSRKNEKKKNEKSVGYLHNPRYGQDRIYY